MAAIFEEFANGEDFNASDFNTLVMRQAIIACDNQTDRDSILTPQEGMHVYRKDIDAVELYDGSAWLHIPRLLKRVALTVAGDTISLTNIPLRDHYTAKIYLKDTGGTVLGSVRFNNDSNTRYAVNGSSAGGAWAVATSGSSFPLFAAAESYPQFTILDINNPSGEFKTVFLKSQDMFGADATTTSNFYDARVKYADNAQISRMDVINAGAGDFAIGSYAEIYG